MPNNDLYWEEYLKQQEEEKEFDILSEQSFVDHVGSPRPSPS